MFINDKSLTTISITINIAINWVISFMSSGLVLDFIRDIYLKSETLWHVASLCTLRLALSLMAGSFPGVLRCHTSDPSIVSSWKLLLSPLFSAEAPLLSLGLGGGAGGVTLVGFLGLGRVGGGCFFPGTSGSGEWSVTGSSSGMAGSGGEWPLCVWPLVRLRGEGAPTCK